LGLGVVILAISTSILYIEGGSAKIHGINMAKTSLSIVTQNPTYYSDGCSLAQNATTSGPCKYGKWSSKVKVVLFGDSHAGQWQEALADLGSAHNFEEIALVKGGCPSANVTVAMNGTSVPFTACDIWRKNMIDRINNIEKPDLIILSNLSIYKPLTVGQNKNTWWSNGLQDTIAKLKTPGRNILIIGDTPFPVQNIPDCLIKNPNNQSKCDIKEKYVLKFSNSAIEKVIAQKNNVTYIDPRDWLCTTSGCPAVVNGIVAYRDASHLSIPLSRKLEPILLNELKKQLGEKIK